MDDRTIDQLGRLYTAMRGVLYQDLTLSAAGKKYNVHPKWIQYALAPGPKLRRLAALHKRTIEEYVEQGGDLTQPPR